MDTLTQIKFGLMPEPDYATMQQILDYVNTIFPHGTVHTLELGVHRGDTSRGIHEFFVRHKRIHFHTGIDNGHDIPNAPEPYEGCHMIIGNTFEVYNEIENDSQHFVFIDANHSFPMTLVDFYCYCKKVRKNGFIALHDTGAHIGRMQDYQHLGSREDPDMYIACRRAAAALGILNDRSYVNGCIFEKVIDHADKTFVTGGILCLKRIQ